MLTTPVFALQFCEHACRYRIPDQSNKMEGSGFDKRPSLMNDVVIGSKTSWSREQHRMPAKKQTNHTEQKITRVTSGREFMWISISSRQRSSPPLISSMTFCVHCMMSLLSQLCWLISRWEFAVESFCLTIRCLSYSSYADDETTYNLKRQI